MCCWCLYKLARACCLSVAAMRCVHRGSPLALYYRHKAEWLHANGWWGRREWHALQCCLFLFLLGPLIAVVVVGRGLARWPTMVAGCAAGGRCVWHVPLRCAAWCTVTKCGVIGRGRTATGYCRSWQRAYMHSMCWCAAQTVLPLRGFANNLCAVRLVAASTSQRQCLREWQ